jgi:hypothetical protein
MSSASQGNADLSRFWRIAAAAVLLAGLVVLGARCWALRHRAFIGSPDEAAYAHQADMILAGHGLRVNYIQHFFRRYDGLPHPADHYGPGYGVLLAPIADAMPSPPEWAAVLPALAAGSLILPLLTLLAAGRVGAGPSWAAAAGFFVLLAPLPQQLSGRVLADMPFTCLLLAAWLVASGSRPAPTWRGLWTGVLMGAAYLLKPAALLHVPGVLIALWLGTADGEGDAERRPGPLPLVACAVALTLVAAPWMARNAALFGDPLHSANKHIAAGQDYREDWVEHGLRRVWWARDTGPPTLDEIPFRYGIARVGDVWGERLVRAVAGPEVRWLTLALLVGAVCLRRREGWSLATFHLSQALLLAMVFPVWSRYLLLLWPAAAAVAAGAATLGVQGLVQRAPPDLNAGARILGILAGIALGATLAAPGPGMLVRSVSEDGPSGSADRIHPVQQATKRAARWCATGLPEGSTVMTQDCWRMAYYSKLPTVNLPSDAAWAIDEVVREYGVTHVVLVPLGTRARYAGLGFDYLEASDLAWSRQEAPLGIYVFALSSPASNEAM